MGDPFFLNIIKKGYYRTSNISAKQYQGSQYIMKRQNCCCQQHYDGFFVDFGPCGFQKLQPDFCTHQCGEISSSWRIAGGSGNLFPVFCTL
ncbi:hypothetical protein T4D_8177 [Trichinella pseudospiralis]|uniref:Uncharacterized protein n=1 Tax=Trichinella pseudospiralis TaxID=6337 RepID=A0A0V1G414_TRIPS|nr:hypothetical protein T4D_8177 [Trichinella pseudospiralis]